MTESDPIMNDQEVSELAQQWPDWNVWRSQVVGGQPGKVYATRRRDLTAREICAGLAPTLPAGYARDHIGTLRRQLDQQQVIEEGLRAATP
jgi:hypothetical protein